MLHAIFFLAVVGQDLPSLEAPSNKLRAATVTVRVLSTGEADATDPESELAKTDKSPSITICSGVSLGGGLIVTSASAATGEIVRVTLPGGGQAKARPRVVDEHSGLVLLETDGAVKPSVHIELAEELPNVGAWVVAAAAWGSEQPVVSFGIVSGHDRTFPGGGYPPLLQCDVRTAETSEGGGVVNTQGKLVGLVVATDAGNRRGWTYVVPVQHIRRLLRSRTERASNEESVIVLKRVRPKVGMVLNADGDAVVVSRIEKDSPAEKAGIQVGDRILAADGIQVRSVYQAVRPVVMRQPGDVVEFLVQQQDGTKKKEIVLGGGVELPSANADRLAQLVRPKLQIEGLAGDGIRSRSGEGQVRELLRPRTAEVNVEEGRREATSEEKIKLLEDALEGYRSVILYFQEQLRRREQERDQAQNLLKALKSDGDSKPK